MRRFAFYENLVDQDLSFLSKHLKFGLKWVHMAQYELILRLDGALWLTIISQTPLTPRRAIKNPNLINKLVFSPGEDTTKLYRVYMHSCDEDRCF